MPLKRTDKFTKEHIEWSNSAAKEEKEETQQNDKFTEIIVGESWQFIAESAIE